MGLEYRYNFLILKSQIIIVAILQIKYKSHFEYIVQQLFLLPFAQLVRPVTMVPSVPGIPGPSSPQPVQSEAKMVNKIYSFCIFLEPVLHQYFPLKTTSKTQFRPHFVKLWTALHYQKNQKIWKRKASSSLVTSW